MLKIGDTIYNVDFVFDERLFTREPIYHGKQTLEWIRKKEGVSAADTVTVSGIPKRKIKGAKQRLVSGYSVVGGKRVYNDTALIFSGTDWIKV